MEVGEILLDKQLLDPRQLEMARQSQTAGARLDQVAVEMGFVEEDAALRALAEQLEMDSLN